MLTVNDLSMQFGSSVLFSRVDLQFTAGNCYGIIGANGAGKSTFIKILSGELEPTSGSVVLDPKRRMSVLKQNQNMYDAFSVMDTVIMGNQRLYDCGKEKDAIYDKPDFTDEDGIRAAELEEEFAELGGWEAESDAGRILQGRIQETRKARLLPVGRPQRQLSQALHRQIVFAGSHARIAYSRHNKLPITFRAMMANTGVKSRGIPVFCIIHMEMPRKGAMMGSTNCVSQSKKRFLGRNQLMTQ